MVNKNTPAGLQSDQTFSGSPDNGKVRMYLVPAAQTTAIFAGDPVVKLAGAASNAGVGAVTLATGGAVANVGNAITGAVVGFAGTDVAGKATLSPSLYGLPPGPMYRPAGANSKDFYVLVNIDPAAEYVVQVGNVVTGAAVIGKNANLIAAAGSTATGLSGYILDAANASVNALQVEIVAGAPGSDLTQPYAKYIVRNNVSTETKGSAGI